jgi:hypothetical protein
MARNVASETAIARRLADMYGITILSQAWRLRMEADGNDMNLGHLKP